MNTRRIAVYRPVLLIALTLLAWPAWSQAATRTWSGQGGNALWSTPGNWQGGVAPVDGDELVFPVTSGPAVTTNDLPNLLVLSLSSASNRTFSGAGIRLQNGMSISGAGPITVTIDLPVTLLAAQTWTSAGNAVLASTANGTIALGGFVFTCDALISSAINLAGVISGTGEIVKNGPGSLALSGANTYAGPTRLNAGFIQAQGVNALGVADGTPGNGTQTAANTTLTVGPGALPAEALTLAGGLTGGAAGTTTVNGPVAITGEIRLASASTPDGLVIASPITGSGGVLIAGTVTLAAVNTYAGGTRLEGPGSHLIVTTSEAVPGAPAFTINNGARLTIRNRTQTLASLTSLPTQLTGLVQLESTGNPGETGTLILNGAADTAYAGRIGGNGTLVHSGTGRQILNGDSTGLLGTASVTAGTLDVGGIHPTPFTVDAAGHLVIRGRVGAVSSNGGEVVAGPKPAALTTEAASLALTGGAFRVDLSELTVGPYPAQLTVPGAVSIGNATLAATVPTTFSPALGAQLTLIDKTTPGAILGTFAGLAEGAEFTAGHVVFQISYVGGDGNDVVLSATNVARTYLLSEGATSNFFTTEILLANPNNAEVAATVEFFPVGAPSILQNVTMAPLSRQTIKVNDIPGLAGGEFSTEVKSPTGAPLIVERTMSWDTRGYGSHTEHAADALATTWYFAEGSQGFFRSFLLLANPQNVANEATVQYLRSGEPPISRTYPLQPRSRFTVDISTEPELDARNFGMVVTFQTPGMAERAQYFGFTPFLTGGHESAGVTAPSPTWFLPEGATGPFFETFILIANPGDQPVQATVNFLPLSGEPVQIVETVDAKGRNTINVEQMHPSLANTSVATQVTAPTPVVVERAQYWPDPYTTWHETHNAFGVTSLGSRWGLAEGRVGTERAYQTYILLANPGDAQASVTITFLRDGGRPPISKAFLVEPRSRFNVAVGASDAVPELQNETFGAVIESTQPIAVERAMYNDAIGQVWAGGTSATAVRLP